MYGKEYSMNNLNEIKTKEDTEKFRNFFYDACIKSLEYETGMYVDENSIMHPVNDKRRLTVIFQNQQSINNTICVIFDGLIELILNPNDINYDDIINGVNVYFEENYIVWDNEKDRIKAESIKYKVINL